MSVPSDESKRLSKALRVLLTQLPFLPLTARLLPSSCSNHLGLQLELGMGPILGGR